MLSRNASAWATRAPIRLAAISKQFTRSMSSPTTAEKPAEVIHHKVYGGRIFVLNRPKAYNALNLSMIRNMFPQLQAWASSDLCKVIIVKAATAPPEQQTVAFCAGGDVVSLIKHVRAKETAAALEFFREEYALNHLIGTIKKPFVSIMDGITMGGGVGISIHAPFRIATERTMFAMPETNIGFFTDVGGSFFLPRLDGALGRFLALTGARLSGVDNLYAGIATHYVPSSRIPALEARLCELESDDRDVIGAAIDEFAEDVTTPYTMGGLVRQRVDRCFSRSTLPAIIEALEKEGDDWSEDVRATLMKMSPTSLKVTLELLRRGNSLSFASCLNMEFGVAQRMLISHDFAEGVTANLIDKPRRAPVWDPASLEAVDDKRIIADYFEAPSVEKLSLRSHSSDPGSWFAYPYAFPRGNCNMPNEREIRELIEGSSAQSSPTTWKKDELLDHLVEGREGRKGVRVVAEEILQRKAIEGKDQFLTWAR